MRSFFRSLFQRTAETSVPEPQLKVLLTHNDLNLTKRERAELVRRLQNTIHDFLQQDEGHEPVLSLLEEEVRTASK